jgi:hypothetical protein
MWWATLPCAPPCPRTRCAARYQKIRKKALEGVYYKQEWLCSKLFKVEPVNHFLTSIGLFHVQSHMAGHIHSHLNSCYQPPALFLSVFRFLFHVCRSLSSQAPIQSISMLCCSCEQWPCPVYVFLSPIRGVDHVELTRAAALRRFRACSTGCTLNLTRSARATGSPRSIQLATRKCSRTVSLSWEFPFLTF